MRGSSAKSLKSIRDTVPTLGMYLAVFVAVYRVSEESISAIYSYRNYDMSFDVPGPFIGLTEESLVRVSSV